MPLFLPAEYSRLTDATNSPITPVMATPSLRQLDIFAQMVAAGSVARCAHELGLSPDDVVRDIASLELRLGYRLFDDLPGRARLTAAGRKTAEAMTILSQEQPESWPEGLSEPGTNTAATEAAAPAPPPRQPILLAAPAPVFGHIQEALAAFEAANEDVSITLDLTVHLAADAAEALAARRADIAYFYAHGDPQAPLSRYAWSEQINLYAGEEHPLSRQESVRPADLANTPMLAMDRRNPLRHIVEEALASEGVALGPAMLESDNMFDIMTLLREGAGCFAAFGPLARDLGRMSGIRRLSLERPLAAVEIRQATRPDAGADTAVAALAEFLFL